MRVVNIGTVTVKEKLKIFRVPVLSSDRNDNIKRKGTKRPSNTEKYKQQLDLREKTLTR